MADNHFELGKMHCTMYILRVLYTNINIVKINYLIKMIVIIAIRRTKNKERVMESIYALSLGSMR